MSLNIIAWHDRDSANHLQMVNNSAAQGYRTLSLSVYGDRNNPRYAAVMIKRPVVRAVDQFNGMNGQQFVAKFNEMAAKGYGPYIISATGPATDPLFAACFQPMSPIPLTRHALTEAEFRQMNADALKNGQILKSVDAYGSGNDIRYAAVWFPNPDRIQWNCDALNDDNATINQRFNAFTGAWARPTMVGLTPSLGVFECFDDTNIGPWVSRINLTSAQYQAEFNTQAAAGLSPIWISVQTSAAGNLFSVIFASQETPNARTWRVSQPETSVAEIDEIVKKSMQANNVRGGAIAITKGTRLVYAKGYTLAEPSYPAVQPTTLFRQASVSKMFPAIAIYQLLEEGKLTNGLDTTMQSVLQLKAPKNTLPVKDFDKISIRHLLEMTAGIDPGIIFYDNKVAAAHGINLPVKPADVASYAASLPLAGTPGDPAIGTYSNGAYFMLSQVVAKLRGTPTFEEALNKHVFAPLKISRIRQSATLVSAKPADEVRYNTKPLTTSYSVMTDDRPLVTTGYGETNMENCDGSGGLSAAVTDIARVLASFSAGNFNPAMTKKAMLSMFENAATKGRHGFDQVGVINAEQKTYWGQKGGSLSTSQNCIYFETGGYSMVISWSGTTPVDGTWYYNFPAVLEIAKKKGDWNGIDLFPNYNMPSFPTTIKITRPVLPV